MRDSFEPLKYSFSHVSASADLDQVSRVFAPVFTTKSDGRGTGLGLAIVKSIIETHDGNIQVRSDPPHGTAFTLSLPVHQHGSR